MTRVIVLVVSVLLIAGCGTISQCGGLCAQGQVTNSKTGAPIQNATVCLEDKRNPTCIAVDNNGRCIAGEKGNPCLTTDSEGRFEAKPTYTTFFPITPFSIPGHIPAKGYCATSGIASAEGFESLTFQSKGGCERSAVGKQFELYEISIGLDPILQ